MSPAPLSVSLLLTLWLCTGLSAQSRCECDDGYEAFPAFPDSRYKLYPGELAWVDALYQCQRDGGDSLLTVVNSVEEAEVIKQLMARLDPTKNLAWVGINDIAEEGVWLTVQGGLLTESGYGIWRPDQPNEGTAANCGLVNLNALYLDDPCAAEWPSICEKPNV